MDEMLRGQLAPGEKVVWEGRPKPGVLFTSADFLLIPFSIVWCAFAIFWTTTASVVTWGPSAAGRSTPAFPFPIFGLMFVAVGLYFVIGRFAVDAWLRGRTRYALTERRVLIVRAPPFGRVTALTLARLTEVSLRKAGDSGAGSIRFGPAAALFGRNGFSIWSPALDPTPQFIAIADAQKVYDLVQRRIARGDQ